MKLILYPRRFFLVLIRLYQKTLSPDHGYMRALFPGGYCKFTPSCSEFMYASVEKYGVLFGFIKGMYRIMRCNPCSRGGMDTVK